jgi:hypothetical protein
MTHTLPRRWRRIGVAPILALFIAALAPAAHAATPVPGIDYTTGPTDLQPTPITVLKSSSGLAPGDIFVGPKKLGPVAGQQGAEIIDNQGRPIWFQPVDTPYTATDFRVQRYQGKPVLTFGVGQSTGGPGHSEGEDVILDRHYHQVATVAALNVIPDSIASTSANRPAGPRAALP